MSKGPARKAGLCCFCVSATKSLYAEAETAIFPHLGRRVCVCAARVCASTGVRRQGRGGRGVRPAPSPGLRAPTPSFASAAHCLATCAGAGGKGLSEMRPTDLRPACAPRQGAEGAGNCAIHHVREASTPPAAPGGPAGPALRGEAATSGVASGTARGALGKAEGRGGGAGFPCLEGISRPSGDRRPALPGPRIAARVRRVQAASPQAWPPPRRQLCAGWGEGGAEGGSGREPEVGPAAFPRIRRPHSLPPSLVRVPGWELAASYWKCVGATFLLSLLSSPCGATSRTFLRVPPPRQGPGSWRPRAAERLSWRRGPRPVPR